LYIWGLKTRRIRHWADLAVIGLVTG